MFAEEPVGVLRHTGPKEEHSAVVGVTVRGSGREKISSSTLTLGLVANMLNVIPGVENRLRFSADELQRRPSSLCLRVM